MGIISLILPPINGIDKGKLLKMCLVHDVAESIVGDLTPADPRYHTPEKHLLEKQAMEKICNSLKEYNEV